MEESDKFLLITKLYPETFKRFKQKVIFSDQKVNQLKAELKFLEDSYED